MDVNRRKFLAFLGTTTAATVVSIPSIVKASSASDLSKVEAFAAMMKGAYQLDTVILDDEYVVIPVRRSIVHCCIECDAHFLTWPESKTCSGCKKQTPKNYLLLNEVLRSK